MKQLIRSLLTACTAIGIFACGGGSDDVSEQDQRTYLRFINGVADARSLDLLINNEPSYTNVRYLTDTGYFRIDSRDQEIRINVSGTFTALYDKIASLADDSDQSLVAYGTSDKPKTLLLQDDNEGPGDDVAKVRIVNLVDAVRSVDVYVVGVGAPITQLAPTADSLSSGSVSDYLASEAGVYRIAVTERDSKQVLANISSQSFGSNQVYTILIGDTAPGRLPPRLIVLRDR